MPPFRRYLGLPVCHLSRPLSLVIPVFEQPQDGDKTNKDSQKGKKGEGVRRTIGGSIFSTPFNFSESVDFHKKLKKRL